MIALLPLKTERNGVYGSLRLLMLISLFGIVTDSIPERLSSFQAEYSQANSISILLLTLP